MEYNDNIFTEFATNPEKCASLLVNNPHSIAFTDKYPDSKIHILVIPKGKYLDIYDFLCHSSIEEQQDFNKTLLQVIEKFDLYTKGFNLLVNTKENHGQRIFHYHMHIKSNS